MPDLTDAREWTLSCENYVWHAKPGEAVPVVKNGEEIIVVPKSAMAPREDEEEG